METGNKIKYLEGVRGIAALMVAMHHLLLAFYPSVYFGGRPESSHLGNLELDYWRSPFSVITNGEFMVSLFFVLSGYVLSRSYIKNNNIETLVSSSIRRFFRLYIPVAFALILAFIALHYSFGQVRETAVITHSDWLSDTQPWDKSFKTFFGYLSYYTMFKGDSRYVTSTWTMSIELYGSVLVFALLSLTHKARSKWVIFLIIGIIAYYLFNVYYIAFIFGISLNYLDKIPVEKIRYRKIIVPLLLITGLILGGFPSWQWNPERETFYRFASSPVLINNPKTIQIFGATFIIIAILLSSALQKIFSGKLFIFLGDISFSAYLIHPVILSTFSCWLFLGLFHSTGNYNLSGLIAIAASIPVVVIIGKLMTIFVDKPGVRFSKYVYTRYFKAKEQIA
ncbi:MAG: acyltransferase family protein [Bacteroidia bacterium]